MSAGKGTTGKVPEKTSTIPSGVRSKSGSVSESGGGQGALLALQRAAGNQAVTHLLGRSSGRPLDAVTRRKMESKFGESFRDVQVHTDSEASKSAEVLGANAWTDGRDIVFGEGRYAPETRTGRARLAHELAHVAQQRRGGAAPETFETQSASEHDAGTAAAQINSSCAVDVTASTGVGVAREEAELPWWKKKLNPIYQRVLEVLPKEAAQKLEEANAVAKQYVEKTGTSDETLNKVVQSAEPVIGPAAAAIGLKDEAGPPPPTAGQVQTATPPPANETQAAAAPPQPALQPQAGSDQQAAPAKNGSHGARIDYAADENAYSGLELEYTAKGDYPTEGVTSPGIYRAKFYWLAPHLRTGTDKVVYYIAYNPEIKRNEYVIGPGQIQAFLAQEDIYRYTAAGAYPLRGEPSEYKALSGRVVAKAMEGDFSGAFQAWKASWKAAAKDPNFWVDATLSTAGGLAGAAGPASAEAREATTGLRSATSAIADESASLATKVEAAGGTAEIPKPRAAAAPVPDVQPQAPATNLEAPSAPIQQTPAPVIDTPPASAAKPVAGVTDEAAASGTKTTLVDATSEVPKPTAAAAPAPDAAPHAPAPVADTPPAPVAQAEAGASAETGAAAKPTKTPLAKGMSTGEAAEADALKPSRSDATLLGEKAGGYDAYVGGKKVTVSEVVKKDKLGDPIVVRDVVLEAPEDAIQIKTLTQLDKYGRPTTKPLPDLVADNVKAAVRKAYNQPRTVARARSPVPGTNIYERINIEAPKKITIIVQVPGAVTQEMTDAAARALASDTRLAELPPVEVIVQPMQ